MVRRRRFVNKKATTRRELKARQARQRHRRAINQRQAMDAGVWR